MPVVVSSALETSVGIRAGLALAAALPELPYACGLNTVALLADDPVAAPLNAENGFLEVRSVEPDPAGSLAAPRRLRSGPSGSLGSCRPRGWPQRCGSPVGEASRCAGVIVAELMAAGVREVVLAPGQPERAAGV